MRNVTKLLCVVLALVIALSAASCSLTKQYAYQKDGVELPVGVYIYYLYQAYTEAESLAQQTDAYDSETGKYNGKKSFLKVEITDSDDNTAVAEDWIKDKAAEYLEDAIAICYEFNAVGATLDELGPNDTFKDLMIRSNPSLKESFEEGSDIADYLKQYYQIDVDQKLSEFAASFEEYGIGFDSWLMVASYSEFGVGSTLDLMKSEAFKKEYGEGGSKEVTTDELTKYFTENYYSYTTLSANLYTTETADDESGTTTDVAMSKDEVEEYEDAFKAYAEELSDGTSMDDVVAEYNDAFDADASASPTVVKIDPEKLDEDTDKELKQAVLDLKEGEATYKIIGEDDNTRQIYLIYKAPIQDSVSEYVDDEDQRLNLLHDMKDDAFDDLLTSLKEDNDFKPSSACNGYKPSMFEKKK